MCIIIIVICWKKWSKLFVSPHWQASSPSSSPSLLFLITLTEALAFLTGLCTQWLCEDRGGNAWLQRAAESLHRPEQSSKTEQDLGQPASRMEGWEDSNKRGSQKYEEVRHDIETGLQRNTGRWRQKDSGNVVKHLLVSLWTARRFQQESCDL